MKSLLNGTFKKAKASSQNIVDASQYQCKNWRTLTITEHSISRDFCLLGEEKLSNKTPNCGAGAGSWHATYTIVWPTDLKCHTSNHVSMFGWQLCIRTHWIIDVANLELGTLYSQHMTLWTFVCVLLQTHRRSSQCVVFTNSCPCIGCVQGRAGRVRGPVEWGNQIRTGRWCNG